MTLVEVKDRAPFTGAIGRVMFERQGLCWIEFDPPLIVPFHFGGEIHDATHRFAFIRKEELTYLREEDKCL